MRSKGKISFINLQSQSKMLGRLTIFFPPKCWCARFGELPAINNVCRTRGRTRSKKTPKKQRWVEVSQLLLSETVGLLIKNSASHHISYWNSYKLESRIEYNYGSLSKDVLGQNTPIRSGIFAFFGGSAAQVLGQIVSIRVQKLSNPNLVASRKGEGIM